MKSRNIVICINELGFRGDSGPYDAANIDLGKAEVALHELAHSATLGYCPEEKIDVLCRKMSPKASDWNEIKALATELVAAQKLGLKIRLEKLAPYATYGMKTERFQYQIPIIIEVRRILKAKSIQKLARHMVAAVCVKESQLKRKGVL